MSTWSSEVEMNDDVDMDFGQMDENVDMVLRDRNFHGL
jgi:hypothetical protein